VAGIEGMLAQVRPTGRDNSGPVQGPLRSGRDRIRASWPDRARPDRPTHNSSSETCNDISNPLEGESVVVIFIKGRYHVHDRSSLCR